MSVVRIPPQLRSEVGGAREVPAEGGTVRELLDDLMSRFPSLRPQLVELVDRRHQPPAIAGRRMTVAPCRTGVSMPSSVRTSSPST